jgi:hypothetical protein
MDEVVFDYGENRKGATGKAFYGRAYSSWKPCSAWSARGCGVLEKRRGAKKLCLSLSQALNRLNGHFSKKSLMLGVFSIGFVIAVSASLKPRVPKPRPETSEALASIAEAAFIAPSPMDANS